MVEAISTTSSSPPPLPPALSSRLQSSINPRTGQCKFHPTVQLCELVQNNSRWVVRRKICYKCGSRPGAVGGKHHMPGKCVLGVNRESKLIGEKAETTERGRQRMRSTSVVRSSSRSASMRSSSLCGDRLPSPAAGGGRNGRARSVSVTRATRSVSVGANSRERLNATTRSVRRSISVSQERNVSSVEDVTKEQGDKFKSNNHRHNDKSMTVIERSEKVKSNSRTDANAHSTDIKSTSRERVLEFTQSAIEDSEDKGHSQVIVTIEKKDRGVHKNATDDSNDFDESDPIIMIPTIHLNETYLPPPPPRSSEEMKIHEHRMELRRNYIRHQRRESSKSENKLNAIVIHKETGGKQLKNPQSCALQKTDTAMAASKELSRRHGLLRKRSDSPPSVSATPVHPSLAVLTALENHRKKVQDKESVPDQDIKSETSSISTGSAKLYRRKMEPDPSNELHSRHPELKGAVSDLHQFPPVNVTVDRSRSRSKSRPRITVVDPVDAPEEKEMQLAVYGKTNGRRLSSARGIRSGVRKSSKVQKKNSIDQDAVTNNKVTKRSHGKRLSKRSSSSRSHHHENFSKVHPEKTPPIHKSRPTSAAQRSSRSLSGRVWDADGNDLSGKRTSKSVERSSSLAKSNPTVLRGQSSGASKDGRSRHTGITQSESESSADGLVRKSNTKDLGQDIVHKKRATRRSRKKERRESVDFDDNKPMTAISYSEDERSHASSISAGSSSTFEESFHSECEDEKKTGETKTPADVKEKAICVLKEVKGGAKHLAVKSKSALGGLKGTSKKWQSALFM